MAEVSGVGEKNARSKVIRFLKYRNKGWTIWKQEGLWFLFLKENEDKSVLDCGHFHSKKEVEKDSFYNNMIWYYNRSFVLVGGKSPEMECCTFCGEKIPDVLVSTLRLINEK